MRKNLIALLTVLALVFMSACTTTEAESSPSPDVDEVVVSQESSNVTDATASGLETSPEPVMDVSPENEDTAQNLQPNEKPEAQPHGSRNAYELLTLANNAYLESESYIMSYYMDIDMSIDGAYYATQSTDGNISIIAGADGDVQFSLELVMGTEMEGDVQTVEMTAYFLDGYYYIDAYGEKMKLSMPVDVALGETGAMDMSFPEKAVLEQSIEGNALTFILSGEAMSSLVDEAMAGAFSEEDDMTIVYSDVICVATINDDGELEDMTMSLGMDITYEGQTIGVMMDMYMEIVQIGGVVIEFPNDLDSYIESAY